MPNLHTVESDYLQKQEDDSNNNHANDTNENFEYPSNSFIPAGQNLSTEAEAISEMINPTTTWPTQSTPITEYKTIGLASMCYPWLFPDGKGDPTTPCPLEKLTFLERVQHLMKLTDLIDEKPVWRFASDETYPFWCLDRHNRFTVNNQASFFIKQNVSEANLTVNELRNLSETESINLV